MLSIGTFSKMSEVATKTLRYYDEIGLLKPAYVNAENGYRYYAAEQLKTILMINRLKMYCFSLEEIGEILKKPEEEQELPKLIRLKQNKIKEQVAYYQYVLRQLEKDISNLERGIHMMSYLDDIEVKLVETETEIILFRRNTINFKDQNKYMMELMETAARENLTVTGAPFVVFHGEEYNPEHYDLEIGLPVKEAVTNTRSFGGELCAMSVLKGPYGELPSVYAKMKQWVEDNGYEISNSPYEVYMTDPSQVLPEENVTVVYFPVKK